VVSTTSASLSGATGDSISSSGVNSGSLGLTVGRRIGTLGLEVGMIGSTWVDAEVGGTAGTLTTGVACALVVLSPWWGIRYFGIMGIVMSGTYQGLFLPGRREQNRRHLRLLPAQLWRKGLLGHLAGRPGRFWR
jgi:hypothetical protein